MAKLLSKGEWFYEISPGSFYESEFENVILNQADLLFPDQFVLPFKITVFSNNGSAKPDFALIDKRYQQWWIIEVEMGIHSLNNHVLPQIEILSQASYGEREALFLCDQNNQLNLERVLDLMKGRPPQVLVIVNSPVPDWEKKLQRYGAILLIVQIFRSDKNHHIFNIFGDYPSLSETDIIVSECYCDPLIPRFLVMDAPAGLELPKIGVIQIIFGDTVTKWERVDSKNKIWLSPIGLNPLVPGIKYLLIRKNDNSFFIRSNN